MFLVGDFILLVIMLVGILIGVAFLTLFERKLLGYVQCRKGPNVVGLMGMLQPFSDAVSLVVSGHVNMVMSNYIIFFMMPFYGLALSMLMWLVIPYEKGFIDFMLGILFFFVISSLGVYSLMLSGWGSNSSYGLLGAYRAVAQTISYEVSMAMILLGLVLLVESYDFSSLKFMFWPFFGWFVLGIMWIVTCVAELNRTPFDFAEGESELVSGFNVEYSGGEFALIFISEYMNILLMGMVSVLIFLGGYFMIMSMFTVMIIILWLRGVLVRYRYDKMMMLIWKSLLPFVMGVLIFGICLNYLVWLM